MILNFSCRLFYQDWMTGCFQQPFSLSCLLAFFLSSFFFFFLRFSFFFFLFFFFFLSFFSRKWEGFFFFNWVVCTVDLPIKHSKKWQCYLNLSFECPDFFDIVTLLHTLFLFSLFFWALLHPLQRKGTLLGIDQSCAVTKSPPSHWPSRVICSRRHRVYSECKRRMLGGVRWFWEEGSRTLQQVWNILLCRVNA